MRYNDRDRSGVSPAIVQQAGTEIVGEGLWSGPLDGLVALWSPPPTRRVEDGTGGGTTLSDDIEPLILDMLEWIARSPRAYGDVMDAWRTSCPRLTVWEDACDRGLVRREGPMVVLTESGVGLLASKRGRQPFA